MRITGFVGSPRVEGSTGALVAEVLRGAAEAGAETALFNLGQMDIGGCRACMACRDSGECSQSDDMTALYGEIARSDGLVLGTPIYFYYMTAQMKAFTDRLFSKIGRGFQHRLGERNTVLVFTQGAADPALFASQIGSMTSAWGMAGLKAVETVHACSVADRVQVLEDTGLMERAFQAGTLLASVPPV